MMNFKLQVIWKLLVFKKITFLNSESDVLTVSQYCKEETENGIWQNWRLKSKESRYSSIAGLIDIIFRNNEHKNVLW